MAATATRTPPRTEHQADHAMARGILYDQLAAGFQPPTAESLGRLDAAGAQDLLEAAAAHLAGADSELARCARRLGPVRPETLGDLELAHARLFGHTPRAGVCAFETEYGAAAPFRQPHELADIAGFYEAFGLKTRREAGERADHVACECEFMGFLARKEAWALTPGPGEEDTRTDHLAPTLTASRSFLRGHLGRFGISFGTRLQDADGESFLGALGALLVALLGFEAKAWNVPLGPATLDLRPPSVDDTPMACGKPGEEPTVFPSPDPGEPRA